MVKNRIKIGRPVDYDEMPMGRLGKVITRNRMLFIIVSTIYFLVGGISTLIVYSFDPVFAVGLLTMFFGIMCICLYLFYMFSKLIWFLRLLSGEKEERREKADETMEKDESDIVYEKIY